MKRVFPNVAWVLGIGLGLLVAVSLGAPAGKGAAGKRGAAAGGAAGGRGGAGGAGGNRLPNPLFAVFDMDQDGVISAKEFEAVVAMIKKLDANGDGQITQDESPNPAGQGGQGAGGGGQGGGGFGGAGGFGGGGFGGGGGAGGGGGGGFGGARGFGGGGGQGGGAGGPGGGRN